MIQGEKIHDKVDSVCYRTILRSGATAASIAGLITASVQHVFISVVYKQPLLDALSFSALRNAVLSGDCVMDKVRPDDLFVTLELKLVNWVYLDLKACRPCCFYSTV